METITPTDHRSALQALYAGMFDFNKPIDERHRSSQNIVAICPIHGEIKTPLKLALTDVALMCPKCGTLKGVLVQKYGREAFKTEISRLYQFAYNNEQIKANQTKVMSPYDKSVIAYTIYQTETPGYIAPEVIKRNTKRKLQVPRTRWTLEQVKETLHSLWSNSFDYPFIEQEFVDSNSRVTVVCPIHGSFSAPLTYLIYKKSGCKRCARHLASLNKHYGPELGRVKMIEHYASIRNPVVDVKQVIPPIPSTLTLRSGTTNNEPEFQQKDDDIMIQSVTPIVKPNNAIVDGILRKLNALEMNDVYRLNISIDVKSNVETTTLVLNDNTQITITRPESV